MPVAIQQCAGRVGFHQRLPGMLPVDVKQEATEFAQLAGRDRGAVDPAASTGLRVNRASHQYRGVF